MPNALCGIEEWYPYGICMYLAFHRVECNAPLRHPNPAQVEMRFIASQFKTNQPPQKAPWSVYDLAFKKGNSTTREH